MMTFTLGLSLALLGAAQDDVTYVRLSVSNFYKTPDGTLWSSGAWQVTREKGAATAKVRLVLEPQAKGGTRRDLKGEMDARDFEKLFADLKKKGILSAEDPVPCGCDAPVFRMAAREGKTEHSFLFGHDHKDQDRKQRALIDGFIKAVEKVATEAAEK
ncbi:MAG TPA: hypothetical protein VNM14_16995 [Planctomycetota bacterium]|nr:hypothetical protein [Planctomycetota bacterium]